MRDPFTPGPDTRWDGARAHILFSLIALIVALAMFAAASGSGNPATLQPLPGDTPGSRMPIRMAAGST